MPSSPRTRPQSAGRAPELQFRLRVVHMGVIALGPGKIDLLTAIQTHGSIARAAKSLGMSYMRAWTLVNVMNQAFRQPLVELERGGTRGGSAQLTPLGKKALNLYVHLVKRCQIASEKSWTELRNHLGK